MKNILLFLNNAKTILRITLEVLFLLSLTGLVIFLLLGDKAGKVPVDIATNFQSISSMLGTEGLVTVLAASVFYIILYRLGKK